MCISPADAETLGVTRFNRNPSPRQDDDIKENQTPVKRDAFKDGCLPTIRNGRTRRGNWCWAMP
jgi:hypothetical protein